MAIPAEATHVVLGGELAQGEIFAAGFWLDGDAPISNAAAGVLAGIIRDIFEASDAIAPLKSLIGPGCVYDKVTVYGYPTGGPVATSVGQAVVAGGAGTGTSSMPLQVALCLTLLTAEAGRRSRGRIYLPMNSSAAITTYQVDPATLTAVVTGFASFLSDINTGGPGPKVSVVSFAGTDTNHVTSVRGDTRADTQRRRANRESILSRHEEPVSA